ncbi:RNA-guided endonuclease TnpB family protein [Micromonospora sp. DR5-3]|uniref:RNA-guided endonuclease TnpB family protein n=1 Tax=Micromonospora sp. DR5-3 TaxID=2992129 RepID=UPI00222FF7B5|nr:RNA-guided endonuclease TnpB family protein [Micromonospora sp. DR5-3]MCW3818977.1 RNA-guided endonuclease TnpB family protein [Micromonospora sp. DR5-3]
MRVTRIAYSVRLNPGKYAALVEQARRLGRVRSEVWQRYGSIGGVGSGLRDRQVRDRWLADGTHASFGVLANAWKETVRDAIGDIAANLEAAKVDVRRAISRRTNDPDERKRMFGALKADEWAGDPFLARQVRKHWKRGRNHTHNQIVVRADKYNTLVDGRGRLWLAIPGLERRKMVRIPLSTAVPPTGTLRLILRAGRVEVHYQIDTSQMRSSQRPCGDRKVGVDKGYTEALTDSDGEPHGQQLGDLLTAESDRLKERNRRRAKLRSIANTAALRGDHAKAHRIKVNNLGTMKRDRQAARHRARVRTEIFTAVHEVVDKANTVIAEDLTKRFTSRKKLPKNINRRLAAWTKGVTAEALKSVSERRGSALVPVNAAYTSQTCHHCGDFGRRSGNRFHCTQCGVVWQADVNAAINILHRAGDPDIALHTPHQRVKQILQDRTDRHRTRLPVQDSSPAPAGRRANYPNRSAMSNE